MLDATYRRLKSGEWGIAIQHPEEESCPVETGEVVEVTKKNGDTKEETVDKVLFTGNGYTICSIVRKDGD